MPQPSASTQPVEEPSIPFYWSDKGLDTQPDLLPTRFFEEEGLLTAQVHRVGSKSGKRSEAKCDVRVKALTAELDYQCYPEFNRANGMLLGVTRLTFSDETRTKIASAEWKPFGKSEFEPPVASSRPNTPLSPVAGSTRHYYRVMLGRKSVHAAECFAGGFIGAEFGIDEDLAGKLPDTCWMNSPRKIKPCAESSLPSKTTNASAAHCASRRTSTFSATK